MLLRNKKNITSNEDLIESYNSLYKGWMSGADTTVQAKYMLDLLHPAPGKRLLDVACGVGKLVRLAKDMGLDATGVDISEEAINLGKTNHPDINIQAGNAESLPWNDGSFDYVTNLGSLEHYLNPEQGCREMSRVLKENGTAVILLPNSHDLETIYKVYKTGVGPDDGQDFERFATRAEWVEFLEGNGFTVVRTEKLDLSCADPHGMFWRLYNVFRAFIPLNLSRVFIFICKKDNLDVEI